MGGDRGQQLGLLHCRILETSLPGLNMEGWVHVTMCLMSCACSMACTIWCMSRRHAATLCAGPATYPWLLSCILQLVFVHILDHSHEGSLEPGAVWQAEECLVLCVQVLTLCCCSPRQELSKLRTAHKHTVSTKHMLEGAVQRSHV
jgi:hypothetical protein